MTAYSIMPEGYSMLGARAQALDKEPSSRPIKPNVIANKDSKIQVIYKDDKPRLCKLERRGKTATCDSFKILKKGEVHYFSYYFGGSPISFFSIPFKSEGQSDTFMVGQMYYDKKTHDLKEPGFCVRSRKLLRIITCSGNDFTINYEPGGNPISVQQNTESPQNSAANGKQYVFQTNSHVDTGISVNPGDKIRVEASGRIRFGVFAGAGGPKGIIFSPEYNYFVDIPHGQLMGRVRQFGAQELDGWVPIGEGREFVARSQGVLEFAVNDNKPEDNAGRFRVEVTIDPAK